MAKKEYEHELVPIRDMKGNVIGHSARAVEIPKMTRDQRKSTQLIGWTKGPGKSKGKRLMRDLFG